jgi:hypothetical protein
MGTMMRRLLNFAGYAMRSAAIRQLLLGPAPMLLADSTSTESSHKRHQSGEF